MYPDPVQSSLQYDAWLSAEDSNTRGTPRADQVTRQLELALTAARPAADRPRWLGAVVLTATASRERVAPIVSVRPQAPLTYACPWRRARTGTIGDRTRRAASTQLRVCPLVRRHKSAARSDPAIDATPTDAATTGNRLRLTGTEWHFNLSTKAGMSQGIWLLKATLFDGSTYTVWVEIKK
jgi:hypothetical protein